MLMGQDYVADDDCNLLQIMMSDRGVQKDYKSFCISNAGGDIDLILLSIELFCYPKLISNCFFCQSTQQSPVDLLQRRKDPKIC